MTWTKTGTDTYLGSSRTSGQTSATLAAGTVGDLRVIMFLTVSASVSVASLSGGGVTTWARAGSVSAVNSTTIGAAATAEIWYGKITGTGTALTIAYNGTVGSTSCRLMKRDFRSSRSGTPTYSASGYAFMQTSGHATGSPLTWPSLTTKGTDELVVGCMGDFGGPTYTGTTAGYTYSTDTDGNSYQYRLSCGAAEVEAAQMTFSGTDGWYAHQAIFDDGLGPVSAEADATGTAFGAGATADAPPGQAAAAGAAYGPGMTATAPASPAAALGAALGASATSGQSAGAAAAVGQAQTAHGYVSPGAGAAAAEGTAFGVIARAGVAPVTRVAVVPAESRTIVVPPDSRVAVVEAESRVIQVPKGDD